MHAPESDDSLIQLNIYSIFSNTWISEIILKVSETTDNYFEHFRLETFFLIEQLLSVGSIRLALTL